ncbi:MAG: hypothetical protein ACI9P5_002899 [Saprospiraceae bacterium]|jgi:hypothetical protein|tara:strand:- start:2743 stop:3318 length:576 start_codon:yes stop_codon:yes gene_type:complete
MNRLTMLKRILHLLLFIIGVCLVVYGLQTWHFKLVDIRLLPEWVPSYNSVFYNLTYGIGLIALSYRSYKISAITTDLIIVLLSFPVFIQISYFYASVQITWIIGMAVLLSNFTLLYKLLIIVIFSLAFDFIGSGDSYATLMYLSIVLLLINLKMQMGSFSNFARYKMSSKNKFIFGILFIPVFFSEVISLL